MGNITYLPVSRTDREPMLLDAPVGHDWASALADYARAQRAAGRAEGTIRLHRHYLCLLARSTPSPWAVTRNELEGVLAREDWRPETRKSCRGALCGFYRWAFDAGRIVTDPSGSLPPIRVPAAVARPAPEHLVKRLTIGSDRVAIMARLAAHCGLRRSEIARVHSRDLVGDELLIHGKGGKVRAVPVIDETLLAILRAADGWLFPGRIEGHISPGYVGKLLSRAMPDGWTAHTLRHRMATVSYAATRDLLAVGAVLGHSRPETTQRYVRMPDDALRAAVRAASAA